MYTVGSAPPPAGGRQLSRSSLGRVTLLSKGPIMFHGFSFKVLCLGCLAGVATGVLLADGTFINFRGEDCRYAIEKLSEEDPAT